MSLISPETIDAIRSRVDIAELVRERVPGLRRAGRNMTARCPFHQERTPSFTVSPERQTFHCFGCGESGDAFAFVMKLDGLTFIEAVERLAERAGVKIAKREEELGPADRERIRMREALAFAAEFYHHILLRSPEADAARKYLGGRGVSPASVEAFKLGCAPRGGPSLLREAGKKGFDAGLLVKAGLASSRDGGSARDFFFGRVLFPILDTKGSVVAFGGRAMDDSHPKYINSVESPVFSKSRNLYGLYQALPTVRKSRRALLVEGYMDALAAHQFGLAEAVAPLGTALTLEQASLLKRYADKIVVLFDADDAGVAAAARAAQLLLGAGVDARVASVPEGKDPDELLQKRGAEPLRRCVEEAVDAVEFLTTAALRKRPGSLGPADKAAVAHEVLAAIALSRDEVLKAEWVRRLARRIDADEGGLLRQLRKEPGAAGSGRRAGAAAPPPAAPRGVAQGAGLTSADKRILALVLRNPELASTVTERDWSSPCAARIWKALAGIDGSQRGWTARLLEALAPEDRAVASALAHEDAPGQEPEADLAALLGRLRRERRLKELEPLLRADAPVEPAVADEYRKLLTELKGSGQGKE